MTLTKKFTTILASVVAATCAVLGIVTLKPSKAFAATENSEARFSDYSAYAVDYVNGKVENDGILYSYDFKPNNYFPNMRVNFDISLYELTDVKTGLESYDKNLTYSALVDSNSSFRKLETVEIEVKNMFKTKFVSAFQHGVNVLNTLYNAETLRPLIYVYKDSLRPTEILDLKTYFESLSDDEISEIATNGKSLPLYIKTPSDNVKYVIAISVDIESYSWSSLGTNKQEKSTGDTPLNSVSPVKSVAEILNYQVENERFIIPMLPEDDGERLIREAYENIVANALERTYTVEYLVPIGEKIPFAKKERQTVTVKTAADGTVSSTDICRAVGVDTFSIFGARYNAVKTNDDVLTVRYETDLWLAAKTIDGKTTNHFLNINESYQEYFHRFVENNIISQGAYEYLYAKAVSEPYPEVSAQGLFYGDVYGYWDYVVLPKTMEAGAILKDVLGNTDKTVAGITKGYGFEDQITAEAYNKLLNEYNYSYLSIAWNNTNLTLGLQGPYMATHYILVCDPNLKDALIDESGSGSKDPDGGKGQQALQGVSGWLSGMAEDLKGLGTDFTAVISGKGSFGQYVAFGGAGIVVLGVFILIIYVKSEKLGNSINSSIRRNKNKWRK